MSDWGACDNCGKTHILLKSVTLRGEDQSWCAPCIEKGKKGQASVDTFRQNVGSGGKPLFRVNEAAHAKQLKQEGYVVESTDLGAFHQPDGPGPSSPKSWGVEFVVGSNDPKWYGNAMRYSTREKALDAGARKADHWTAVNHWRVTPMSDDINESTMVTESIETILSARVTKYSDNGQTIAYIEWRDSKGKTGTTSGDPKNAHMQALLTRAKREGVKIDGQQNESVNLLVKLRAKDYVGASEAFARLMQEKVNVLLTEERRALLLTEGPFGPCSKCGGLVSFTGTCTKCGTKAGGSIDKPEYDKPSVKKEGITITNKSGVPITPGRASGVIVHEPNRPQPMKEAEGKFVCTNCGQPKSADGQQECKKCMSQAKSFRHIKEAKTFRAFLSEAKVECQECGKVFNASVKPGAEPKCPKCGGYDVELNEGLVDTIKAGDRVTIVNRFGQERSGKAVMRGPAGWVLNMGGPHGTPGIASDENIVKVNSRGAKTNAWGLAKESYGDNDDYERSQMGFRNPGGKSALRNGSRVYPCPTCKRPNMLSAKDKSHGYQCDDCADRDEGGMGSY